MALLRKMYPADLEWIVGGQFQEVWLNVSAFVSAFAAQGLHLVLPRLVVRVQIGPQQHLPRAPPPVTRQRGRCRRAGTCVRA